MSAIALALVAALLSASLNNPLCAPPSESVQVQGKVIISELHHNVRFELRGLEVELTSEQIPLISGYRDENGFPDPDKDREVKTRKFLEFTAELKKTPAQMWLAPTVFGNVNIYLFFPKEKNGCRVVIQTFNG